jgi:hypothetical protein
MNNNITMSANVFDMEETTKKFESTSISDETKNKTKTVKREINNILENLSDKSIFLNVENKDELRENARVLREAIKSYNKIIESKCVDDAVKIQTEFRDMLVNLTIEFDFGVNPTMLSIYYIGKAYGIERGLDGSELAYSAKMNNLDELFRNKDSTSEFGIDVKSDSSNGGKTDMFIYRFDRSYRYVFVNGCIASAIGLWVQFIDFNTSSDTPIINIRIHEHFYKIIDALIEHIVKVCYKHSHE